MSDINQEQWDNKIIGLGGSILQSWVWGQFQQALGVKIHKLHTERSLGLGLELSLAMGRKYVYFPRGPLGDQIEFINELKKFSADRANVFVRIEPHAAPRLPRAAKDIQPVNNWVLDLEKDEHVISAEMKPKHRYNINLAQRKTVVVREGGKADLLDVYKLFLETAGRNNFHLHPQNYYWQMWEVLAPRYLKILIAEYQGKPLACMFLTLFGATATYMHGGSSQAMKEAQASYLLHWEAIKTAKAAGMKSYDFGGISPASDHQHSWAGISRFKKGFGGFQVDYPGAFDMVFSPIWYNAYKNIRTLRKILRSS